MAEQNTRLLDVPAVYAAFILTGRAAKVTWVVAGTGARIAAAWISTRPRDRRELFIGRLVDITMRRIQKLGATFIKFAQLLSTRVDVLPPALCAELSNLHDDVPAIKPTLARKLAEKRLGGAFDEVFAEFDPVPVASGSIACVYKGTLHDGTPVAVKLRRPGVDRVLGADFTLFRGVARIMSKLPAFRSLPVREMINELGGAIAKQLDFGKEAWALGALKENLRELDGIVVPAVRADITGPEQTAAGILVMDFIPDLVRRNPADFPAKARDLVVANSLDAVFKMLFQDGLVHNDLHPGNLYFRPDGSIVLVDAGFVTQLSERARQHFTEFFYAMALGRGDRCAASMIDFATVPDHFDEDGFYREVGDLVRSNSGVRSRDFNLLRFASVLFDIQNRYRLYPDPEITFPLLSLLVLEGAIVDFAPDTDFQSRAIPYVLLGLSDAA